MKIKRKCKRECVFQFIYCNETIYGKFKHLITF